MILEWHIFTSSNSSANVPLPISYHEQNSDRLLSITGLSGESRGGGEQGRGYKLPKRVLKRFKITLSYTLPKRVLKRFKITLSYTLPKRVLKRFKITLSYTLPKRVLKRFKITLRYRLPKRVLKRLNPQVYTTQEGIEEVENNP